MDPHFKPSLDHPASSSPPSLEARALYATGWHASLLEGRISKLSDGEVRIVDPKTWNSLRELTAAVPVQLRFDGQRD